MYVLGNQQRARTCKEVNILEVLKFIRGGQLVHKFVKYVFLVYKLA